MPRTRLPDVGSNSIKRPAPVLPKSYVGACILLLLGERRAHGYELRARLPEFGLTPPQRAGRYMDSSTVYRTLRRLEGDGLVCSAQEDSAGGPPRRIYGLTPLGRNELHRSAHALAETGDRLGAFTSRYWSFDRAVPA